MQTLDLNSDNLTAISDSRNPERLGFWQRQFQLEATSSQKRFDWAYGVGFPLICVAADPIVFVDEGMLGEYRMFARVLSAVSILAMAAWLLWGESLRWLAAPLAGLFIAGSAVSCVVGLIILPYSLLGLFILIGFLGFTPLFSTVVYFRNGLRALEISELSFERSAARHAALIAGLFALVIPYVLNVS